VSSFDQLHEYVECHSEAASTASVERPVGLQILGSCRSRRKTIVPTWGSTVMNRKLTARVLIACQLLTAGILLPQAAPVDAGAPISLVCAKPDDPANFGFRPLRSAPTNGVARLRTVFLVTNHTSSTVVANLSAIEVRNGSNWVTQMRPHGPFLFAMPGSAPGPGWTNIPTPASAVMELKPHQTAYATIQFSGLASASGPTPRSPVQYGVNYLPGQPTGAVWRLSVSVQEKLSGLTDASARLTRYSEMQGRLASAGSTNAPMNPFSGAYSYFGKPTRVCSEEVSSR
jgi:hypothetical protein